MPLLEQIYKDLSDVVRSNFNFLRNGGRNRILYVFPDYPSKKTSIHKIARKRHFNLRNKKRKNPELSLYWEDKTFGNPSKFIENGEIDPVSVINFNCDDISKEKVDHVFTEVFGYSTNIDPKSHVGQAVQKSDINAKHDGQIINCPIEDPMDGMVYQVLINNQFSEEEVLDYRIPIIKEALDIVFLKYKAKNIRFDNVTTRVELKKSSELFSPDELAKINLFSEKMGLDFGELDILRDINSKKIYIIDVNKTPYSPPADLDSINSAIAVAEIERVFFDKFTQKNE